jgi:hypothetical protein
MKAEGSITLPVRSSMRMKTSQSSSLPSAPSGWIIW